MKKRSIVQLLVVLLLVLLLAFAAAQWMMDDGERRVTTGGPKDGGFEPAPLSKNQTILEEPIVDPGSPTQQPKHILRPISHSGWVNGDVYEVFGEIENEGVITARGIRLRVHFKDAKWRRLGIVEVPIDRPTLAPGERSSFRVIFRDGNPNLVGEYILMTLTRP